MVIFEIGELLELLISLLSFPPPTHPLLVKSFAVLVLDKQGSTYPFSHFPPPTHSLFGRVIASSLFLSMTSRVEQRREVVEAEEKVERLVFPMAEVVVEPT